MRPQNTADVPTPLWVLLGTVVRCRRTTLVVTFLAALIPLLYLSWQEGQPAYYSEAAIHVAARFPKMLTEDPEMQQAAGNHTRFLQQQTYIITRFEVVQEALRRLGTRRDLWQLPGETETQAVERLRVALEADAVESSFLVTVGLRGGSPEGLAEIVNSVVQAYLDVQRAESLFEPKDRANELDGYRAEIQAQIAQKVAEKSDLAQQLGVSHFDGTRTNPHDQALVETRVALEAARLELMVARLDLEALDAEQQRTLELEMDSEAQLLMQTAGTTEIDPLRTRLSELNASTAGLTPSHPGYEAALREIELIESTLQRRAEAETARIAEVLDRRRRTDAAHTRLQAESLVHRAEQKVSALEEAHAQLAERVSSFISQFAKGVELDADIGRLQAKIAAIEERVSFLTIESAAPGFARLASPARTPELPEKDRRAMFSVASAIVALFLATGVATALELMGGHIRSPLDVQRAAGFAPLGWIAEATSKSTQQQAAEQLRRLALSISREHRNSGTRTFVITSPRRNVSNRSIIQQLGETLCDLNVRTLTVDADASEAAFGEGQPGLLDVMRGAAEPPSVIIRGVPDHLALGTGSDTNRLPESHRIGAVLKLLAQDYQIILINAPPLGDSSDADLLVDSSDATLLLVQAGQDTLGDVNEAVRALERVAPSAVGVIVHGVDPRIPWSVPVSTVRSERAASSDTVSDPLVVEEAAV